MEPELLPDQKQDHRLVEIVSIKDGKKLLIDAALLPPTWGGFALLHTKKENQINVDFSSAVFPVFERALLLNSASKNSPATNQAIRDLFFQILQSNDFKKLFTPDLTLGLEARNMLDYFFMPGTPYHEAINQELSVLAKAYYLKHKQELEIPGVTWEFSVNELMEHNLLKENAIMTDANGWITINLSDSKINDTSIEKLIELKKLDKSKIAHLHLGLNRISCITDDFVRFLATLANLTELSLFSNNLTDLPNNFTDSLLKIRWLWMQGNRLKKLPTAFFAKENSLEKLSISENDLIALPENFLANASKLKVVAINGNLLPKDVINGLTEQVKEAIAAGNQEYKKNAVARLNWLAGKQAISIHDLLRYELLRDDVVTILPNGISLRLGNYKLASPYGIEELVVAKLVNPAEIIAINMPSNNLISITSSFIKFLATLPNLVLLNLNNNKLTDLPGDFLADVPKIKKVFLDRNAIPQEIIKKLQDHVQKAIANGDAWYKNDQLEELAKKQESILVLDLIKHNLLRNDCVTIKSNDAIDINLSNYRLTAINGIEEFIKEKSVDSSKITGISLGGNNLSCLTEVIKFLAMLPNLNSLNLGGNKITSLPADFSIKLPDKIQWIVLNENKICQESIKALPAGVQKAIAKGDEWYKKYRLAGLAKKQNTVSVHDLIAHNLLLDDCVNVLVNGTVSIHLSDYRLTSTDGIEELMSAKLIDPAKIEVINLWDNNLTSITPSLIKFLATLSNLKALNLCNNKVTDLPADLWVAVPNIECVALNPNAIPQEIIKKLPEHVQKTVAQGYREYKRLMLQWLAKKQSISVIDLIKYDLLGGVDLVTALSDGAICIALNNYQLTSIDGIAELIKEKAIDRSKIASVHLAENRISALTPEFIEFLAQLPNLTTLNLSSNTIVSLPSDFLANATKIKYISLYGNLVSQDIINALPEHVQKAIATGNEEYKQHLTKKLPVHAVMSQIDSKGSSGIPHSIPSGESDKKEQEKKRPGSPLEEKPGSKEPRIT